MNGTKLTAASDPQLPEAKAVFSQFKQQVSAEGLLHDETDAIGEDVTTGISDDGALGYAHIHEKSDLGCRPSNIH